MAERVRETRTARGLAGPAVVIVDHGGPAPASAALRDKVAFQSGPAWGSAIPGWPLPRWNRPEGRLPTSSCSAASARRALIGAMSIASRLAPGAWPRRRPRGIARAGGGRSDRARCHYGSRGLYLLAIRPRPESPGSGCRRLFFERPCACRASVAALVDPLARLALQAATPGPSDCGAAAGLENPADARDHDNPGAWPGYSLLFVLLNVRPGQKLIDPDLLVGVLAERLDVDGEVGFFAQSLRQAEATATEESGLSVPRLSRPSAAWRGLGAQAGGPAPARRLRCRVSSTPVDRRGVLEDVVWKDHHGDDAGPVRDELSALAVCPELGPA